MTKQQQSYDPAISLPGIDPEEMKSAFQTNIYTPVFTASLFMISETWKHLRCAHMSG